MCRSAVDAPVNDILLIQRLNELQDAKLQAAGLKMMLRHSWYLSPELATLAIFSALISTDAKRILVTNMITERGDHLLKTLSGTITDLTPSKSFFTH